jgi:excisionase family DNA binding protein
MAKEIKGERKTLTVAAAAHLLGIGRNSAYSAVRSGQLPAIRLGGRILIPVSALERLMSQGSGRPTT